QVAESQGRLADALDDLRKIPDSDEIGAQAWLKAGQIELKRHRARAAEAAFRRSLALRPEQVQSYRELAYIYTLQRRNAECDAQFRALAERMPMSDVMLFAWCQNFCRLVDWPAARIVLSQFVAEDPTDRWSRLALAISFSMNNEFDKA